MSSNFLQLIAALVVAGMLGVSACGDAQVARERAAAVRDSLVADSLARAAAAVAARRADSLRADSIRLDSIRTDSIEAAAARAAADTIGGKADSLSPLLAGKGERRRKLIARLRPAELARWPVKGPAPLPGALLPKHRIVAYYGNPLSKRMGILGQLPPDSMMARLARTAALWQKADSTTTVIPAFHLIATVAQGNPGPAGKYRLQMTDSMIAQVAQWAESRGWLVFLDVQIGLSTVPAELPRLVPFLQRPYVHLALDPEFAMKLGGLPGKRIGTLDASDVNYAIRLLADIVERNHLPPKVLVVHRFTQRMLTNYRGIKLDPRVQVVIDMDGFGTLRLKEDAYRFFIIPEPVQYTGFKLFYKNDRSGRRARTDSTSRCSKAVYEAVGCGDDGLMTPKQVLELYPEPVYIQYQ